MVDCNECKAGNAKGDACVYLAYSKTNLCKEHFFKHFERRVKRTMREFRLLRGAKKIAVGLSGGKDSTALLMCLKPICDSMRIGLVAITADEGIHNYREKLLENAGKLCKELGVKHVVRSYKNEIGAEMDKIMKSANRTNAPCTYCGVFRRWLLNKAAREEGCDRLATGHNLDDAAQTLLMNIMRNDLEGIARFGISGATRDADITARNEPERLARFGAFGAAAENENFIPRIKPLIQTPEREAALYVLLKNADFQFAECTYADDAYRSGMRAFINSAEEKHPGTKLRMLESFLAVKKALADEKEKSGKTMKINDCAVCGEPSSSKICRRCGLAGKLSVAAGD